MLAQFADDGVREITKDEQPQFTLLAQDITADLVVEFWICVNGKVQELVKGGMSPAEAAQHMRRIYHIPPILAGLVSSEKLQGACQIAQQMRDFPYRKVAD